MLVVHHHRHELAEATPPSTEEMLVQSDHRWPRIQPLTSLELQLRVQRPVDVPAGAAVSPSHPRQVTEVFARPQQAASVSLRRLVPLADPGTGSVKGRPQGRQENRRLRTTSRTPMSRNGASRTVTSRWSYT